MAGLTPTGFLAKTFNEILESIKGRLRTFFGSGVDTNEDSIVMQIVDPIAIELEESWQGAQNNYDQMNPNNAEGVALDNIGAVTNTPRVAGAKSVVTVNATGVAGSIIPINTTRGVDTTNELFQTLEQFVLPVVGSQPLVFTMTSLEDGPIAALAGTLNQGSLPAGVATMTNPTDANLGSYDETDEEYRIGRKERLAALAAATVVSIKAAILAVATVTSAKVFENDTDITDILSLPPHSIRAVVSGGADQDIWDTLGIKKGAGTYTDGAEVGSFIDPTDGQTFTMRFSRVLLVDIYVDVVVLTKDSDFPVGVPPNDGASLIEANILALESVMEVGDDVLLPLLQNAVTDVPGILTYTLFFAKTAVPLVDTNISISDVEKADFDSTRTNVTVI